MNQMYSEAQIVTMGDMNTLYASQSPRDSRLDPASPRGAISGQALYNEDVIAAQSVRASPSSS